MNTIAQLRRRGPRAQEAERLLIERGAEVVPELIAALDHSDDGLVLPLWRVLRRLEGPDVVPALLVVASDLENPRRCLAVLDALGRSRDASAVSFLSAAVQDELHRVLAARALANIGDTSGTVALYEAEESILQATGSVTAVADAMTTALETGYGYDLVDYVTVAEALVRLGDRTREVHLVALSGFGLSNEDGCPEASLVRANAISALRWCGGEAVAKATEAALSDPDPEVRLTAVETSRFLRNSSLAATLATLLPSRKGEEAAALRSALEDVLGEPGSADEATFWSSKAASLQPGACYRHGALLHIPDLFEEQREPSRGPWVRRELALISGRDFARDPDERACGDDDAVRRARDWWRRLDQTPSRGTLMRSGHLIEWHFRS